MEKLNLTDKCDEVATLIKAMAHPDRLKILCALNIQESSVSELEAQTSLSQSGTSQYLNRMKLEGLIGSRREGNRVLYFIEDNRVSEIIASLYTIFCQREN
jgi:DNA-binding transcriptional ArsR family regulator